VLSLVPLVSNRYRVEDNEIRLLLVKAFIALDQISEARDMLKDIVIHAPGTDEALLASSILDALGGYELTFDQRLNRAKNLARFRKYDEAANEYQSLLSESPGDPSITDALGRALFSSRQYDRAGEILAKADTAENAYIEVRSLYRSGDQDGFLRRLEEAEAKYPELHGRLYRLKLARAQDLRRAKAFSKAEPLFNQLLDTYPDERSSTLWELGWSQFLRGDHESASATFLQLASVDASNDLDRSLYWLARSYEKLGRSGDAATLFKRISEEFQETYYGTLTRSFLENKPVKGNRPPPPRLPEAGAFLRINELRLVGLLPDARRELNDLASEIKTMEEAQAFARLAADVQDFSRAIQVAEPLSRFNPDFEFVAYPRGFWTNIEEAADREDLDPYLIASVIRKESRFDPRAYSSAGAMGLMQLMPSTARSVSHRAGVPLDSESALFEPEPNIRIGAHYLAGLVREYDRNIVLAVAAYNAGRSAVSMWLDRKVPVPADEFIEEISYPETRNYVKHVIKNYIHYRELWGLTPPSLSAMVGSSEPAKL